jgi:hypothetical protein
MINIHLDILIISKMIHRGWVSLGREHKKRVKEGEYGGYILNSYMKTEQGNLLKLF